MKKFWSVFLVILLVMTAFIPLGALTQKKGSIVIKLAHTVAENPDHPYTIAANTFKDEMQEFSGGTVKVEVYPGGQLGGDTDILQALQLGSIDVAVLSTPVIANITNVLAAVDMPFIFNNDYNLLRKVEGGEIGDYLIKHLNEKVPGIMALNFLYQPFRHVWSSRPVTRLADMKGLKFRCMQSPIHVAIFSALGASPTALSYNDIYSNMQTHTIDAFEMDVFGAASNKFYEVCKNMTLTGHFNNSPILIFSKKVFDSMTPEQQTWARKATLAAADASFEGTVKAEDHYIQLMRSYGVNVIKVDLNEWKVAAQKVIDKYYAEVPEVRYVIDEMKKLK